jgi:hypothetical protein
MGWQIRKPTVIELLVVVATITILLALILPATQWAARGDIRLPVRVLVFDAARGRPIANAHVGIFRAPPIRGLKSFEETPDQYDPRNHVRGEDSGTTGADGAVVIEYEFRTGANHERPTMYAHLTWAWVSVQAEGFGSIVVPVRYESQPTATLRKQTELLISVGLMGVSE